MKTRLALAGAILLSFGTPTFAHRLDEYLRATTLSIEKDRVQAQISLTPGVAVFPIVLAKIDTDADGVISQAEQHAYAERVLRDLSLTIDGDRLRLRLVSSRFANNRGDERRAGRHSTQVQCRSAPQRPQPKTHFRKSSSKPDCGLPRKLSGPARPGYSDHGAAPKLRAVAL